MQNPYLPIPSPTPHRSPTIPSPSPPANFPPAFQLPESEDDIEIIMRKNEAYKEAEEADIEYDTMYPPYSLKSPYNSTPPSFIFFTTSLSTTYLFTFISAFLVNNPVSFSSTCFIRNADERGFGGMLLYCGGWGGWVMGMGDCVSTNHL